MAVTTYLFGAGASAQSLPVVANMGEYINSCITWLISEYKVLYPLKDSYSELKPLIEDLSWLRQACEKKNFSVDTYANQLWHRNDFRNYQKLKSLLSLFFTIEQRRNSPDPRYFNFWNTILKKGKPFPENIRILSWNYDFQIELSYQSYSKEESLRRSSETLNVCSLETRSHYYNDPWDFSIFKLNGSATFELENGRGRDYFIDELRSGSMDSFFDELLASYELVMSARNRVTNHLSFAWDTTIDRNPFFEQLGESIKDTSTLIVIGYSFPDANNKIDNIIINQTLPNLQNIYIQCHPDDRKVLRERLLDLIDDSERVELHFRENIGKFYVPKHLLV